jgi:hypothetical protein
VQDFPHLRPGNRRDAHRRVSLKHWSKHG